MFSLAHTLQAFTRTLQYDGDRSDAWANIGTIFLHAKQYEKAVNALSQVRTCPIPNGAHAFVCKMMNVLGPVGDTFEA